MAATKGVFVTGTDTGVGKTVVSSALVRSLVQTGRSVGVMKPVETGVFLEQLSESDAGRLMAAAGVDDGIEEVSPYRFPAPLAPLAAASAQGRVIEMQEIMRRYERLAARYSCVVVEGAGGLLVPIGKDWDMRDLIGRIGLPVALVGRAGLGGINHALLTLEGLRQRRLTVVAVLLNETVPSTTTAQQEQCASTVALLRERAGVPVLGPLPYRPHLGSDWSGAGETLAQSSPIRELADLVWANAVGRSG
ncbi:MAG: dethiobiotin synthase [Nitrospirota bacterium]